MLYTFAWQQGITHSPVGELGCVECLHPLHLLLHARMVHTTPAQLQLWCHLQQLVRQQHLVTCLATSLSCCCPWHAGQDGAQPWQFVAPALAQTAGYAAAHCLPGLLQVGFDQALQ